MIGKMCVIMFAGLVMPLTSAYGSTNLQAMTAASEEKGSSADRQESEHPAVTTMMDQYSVFDGDTFLGNVAYETITLDTTGQYEELAETLSAFNEEQEAFGQQSVEEMAACGETQTGDVNYMTNTRDILVMRADSKVLSFCVDHEVNLAGPHPNSDTMGYTYDVDSGKRLLLTDVVKDTDALYKLIDEKLKTYYADIYNDFTVKPYDYLKSLDLSDAAALSWNMDSEALNVEFNAYTLGSYAMGAQSVKVYYEEAPEIFLSDYPEVPDEYFIPLHRGGVLMLDTAGKGSKEEVTVTEDANGSQGGNKCQVHIGEEVIDLQYYRENMLQNTYVVRANDQYYMYFLDSGENQYAVLNVIDLKNKTYDADNRPNLGCFSQLQEISGDQNSVRKVKYRSLTDPNAFVLNSRSDILGTMNVYRTYLVGKDGYPLASDDWFGMSGLSVITAKIDVECDLVDENGKVLEKGTIPQGTLLKYIRTDKESWVDLQEADEKDTYQVGEGQWSSTYIKNPGNLEEGKTIYRIYPSTEYPKMLNGMKENEVLDGVLYAG